MTGMTRYYISRVIISAGLVLILALTGLEWWSAALVGVIVLAFFLWAPRSGRYAVHPEHGMTALRRDERTQAINDKAARNGFVVTIGAIAGVTLYFGLFGLTDVPVTVLSLVLALGILTYFVSDFWLRRA